MKPIINWLQKQIAAQKSVNKYSWWSKCSLILKVCYSIIKHIVNIIKIVHYIQQLLP